MVVSKLPTDKIFTCGIKTEIRALFNLKGIKVYHFTTNKDCSGFIAKSFNFCLVQWGRKDCILSKYITGSNWSFRCSRHIRRLLECGIEREFIEANIQPTNKLISWCFPKVLDYQWCGQTTFVIIKHFSPIFKFHENISSQLLAGCFFSTNNKSACS